MKTLLFVAAWLFSVTCFGQTKLISFRSHSGSNANFRNAVEHDMFDIGNSNFGIPPVPVGKIDTVMLKGNDKIIILRKIKRTRYGQGQKVVFETYYESETIIKANQPVFFDANNIDALKALIQKKYSTNRYDIAPGTNPFDSIKFIGFSKQFMQAKATQKR